MEKVNETGGNWIHLQENLWWNLCSKWSCHHHEMQSNCCICIYVRQNKFYNADHEAKLNCVNSYRLEVYARGTTLPYVLFGDEAGFHHIGYVNSQNNSYWCAWNAILMESVLLHEVRVHVPCALRATGITGPILFSETINSQWSITHILTLLL